MHGDELFFSEDEDAENFGEQIRTIEISMKKEPSDNLNNDLFNRMLSDKKKPTPDVLVTLHSQNVDPYAEIDEIECNVPKYRWRSPQKGFRFFQTNHSSTTPVASPSAKAPTTPMSAARRQRLLEKLMTHVLQPVNEDGEEEYIPLSAKRRKLESSDEEGDLNRTPRVLRPRKSEWLEEDLIPLSALRESILLHKKESEQKAAEEKSSKLTPRRTPRSSTVITTTPKSSKRRSVGHRKLFAKKPVEQVKQKRKTCFSSDDSDDELLISSAKRVKTTEAGSRSWIDSDSDDDLPLLPPKKPLSSKL